MFLFYFMKNASHLLWIIQISIKYFKITIELKIQESLKFKSRVHASHLVFQFICFALISQSFKYEHTLRNKIIKQFCVDCIKNMWRDNIENVRNLYWYCNHMGRHKNNK